MIYKLTPALKTTIWGGHRLQDIYNDHSKDNIAEAWVLSCHPDGLSIIADGDNKGMALADVITKADLGTHFDNYDGDFPILIKFIDAADKLSIQVHPDDEYALAHTKEKNGKTEAWYILDAKDDAELIYGFDKKVTREEFSTAIDDGTLSDIVRHCPVKAGDVAFIPGKTLHGIGAGIFLIEVQQSSNTTYRAYDYKRVQADGTLRPLHKEDSVNVTNLEPMEARFTNDEVIRHDTYTVKPLVNCPFFKMSVYDVNGIAQDKVSDTSFVSLVFIEGEGEILYDGKWIEAKMGDSFFITAGNDEFSIRGNCKVLKTQA